MAESFIGRSKLLILIKLLYSVFAIFQDITGLATQLTADTLKRCEADGFGLAGLQDGEVGRRQSHALGEFA